MSEVIRPEDPLASTVADARPISLEIPRLVAVLSGTHARDLPPVERSIDSDAVDQLFGDAPSGARLTFRYAGFRIVITADSRVEVHEPDS